MIDEISRAIGKRIKARRIALGLYQRDLKIRTGMKDERSVRDWEKGHLPKSHERRLRIAKALDIPAGVLFSRDLDLQPKTLRFVGGDIAIGDTLARLGSQATMLRIFRGAHGEEMNIYADYREIVARRIHNNELNARCVELIWRADRLEEILSNIIRFNGHQYEARAYVPDESESIGPGFSCYIFDETDVVFSGLWDTSMPGFLRDGLWLTGPAAKDAISEYWIHKWERATPITLRSAKSIAHTYRIRYLGKWTIPRRRNESIQAAWRRLEKRVHERERGAGLPSLI